MSDDLIELLRNKAGSGCWSAGQLAESDIIQRVTPYNMRPPQSRTARRKEQVIEGAGSCA
jgi:hypothetical protein